MPPSNNPPARVALLAAVAFALIWSWFFLHTPQQPAPTRTNAWKSENLKDSRPSPPEADDRTAFAPASTAAAVVDRPLITYVYADNPNARSNLEFFLAHGLHAAADFVFIMNGESDATKLIPTKANIRMVLRRNECFDLGAHAAVLTENDLYRKYRRFILLNASIRGPFLPSWSQACWTNMYLNKLSDKVKLVGMTGNCWPRFHVQSMIWATDIVGLEQLMFPAGAVQPTTTLEWPPGSTETGTPPPPGPRPGINNCFRDWAEAVKAEEDASQLILAAGYELDVMMTAFHGAAGDAYVMHCDGSANGDVLWQGKYEGTNVHPYETIFLKTNRDIDPVLMDRMTQWHNNKKYTSYDYCI